MAKKNEEANGFSKDIAGKPELGLDDELLPNRGEPVSQESEPRSEGKDAEGAQRASGMKAGGEQASRKEVGEPDLGRGEMRGGIGQVGGQNVAGETRESPMRRTTEGDMRDVRETSSLGETGGMGGSEIMDRRNRGAIEENKPLSREERERRGE